MKKRAIIGPLVRTIAFLLCAAMVYGGVVSVVCHSNTQPEWIHAYRAKDALQARSNSLDVIAVGASASISGFSPMEAYKDYGFSSFSAGVGFGIAPDSYYLLLQEMLKKQQPSVVLIEAERVFYWPVETGIRVISDAVGFSAEKARLLSELPEGYLTDSYLSYFFPILKYHTRYKDITKDDFFDAAASSYYDYFQGFRALHVISVKDTGYPMEESSEIAKPNDTQLNYLEKIINLCRSEGITPVLYKMPCTDNTRWNGAMYNYLKEYTQANGLHYIDFNLPDIAQDVGIDISRDFQDAWHTNFYGAVKVTRYISKYLHDHFDLPDRRGDPAYAYLDQELERYEREKFNEELIHTVDLSSYLDLLLGADDGYTIIVSVRDEAVSGLNEELRKKLKALGFQSDLTPDNAGHHSLIGVRQNGRMVHEELSEGIDDPERDMLEFRSSMPDGIKYYVKSAGWYAGNTSSIIIDGVEKSKNSRGLNIVVYDSISGRVVDSIVFNTYADAGITYSR